MNAFLVVLALLYALSAAQHVTAGNLLRKTGFPASAAVRYTTAILLALASLMFTVCVARAATVAEIPGVAKFTDERGNCPRLWRVAIAPTGERGCWTIDEVSRAVTIRWFDGAVLVYSETRFNIYAQ